MTDTLIHFPVYIGDALKKFIEFPTLQERGAWLSITVALVQNNGVLPDDETIYFKCLAFSDQDKQTLKQTLSKCLSKTERGWESEEVNELIYKQKSMREQRRNAGRKGGLKSNQSKQTLKQSESESESELELDKEQLKKKDEAFELFWKEYPRKDDKRKAELLFNKIRKGTSHEEIVSGATKYKLHCQANSTIRKYIKLPTSWLNAGSWENEYGEDNKPLAKKGIKNKHWKELQQEQEGEVIWS